MIVLRRNLPRKEAKEVKTEHEAFLISEPIPASCWIFLRWRLATELRLLIAIQRASGVDTS